MFIVSWPPLPSNPLIPSFNGADFLRSNSWGRTLLFSSPGTFRQGLTLLLRIPPPPPRSFKGFPVHFEFSSFVFPPCGPEVSPFHAWKCHMTFFFWVSILFSFRPVFPLTFAYESDCMFFAAASPLSGYEHSHDHAFVFSAHSRLCPRNTFRYVLCYSFLRPPGYSSSLDPRATGRVRFELSLSSFSLGMLAPFFPPDMIFQEMNLAVFQRFFMAFRFLFIRIALGRIRRLTHIPSLACLGSLLF